MNGTNAPWTGEQIKAICSDYTHGGALVCGECSGAVRAERGSDGTPDRTMVTFMCSGCHRSTTQAFMTIRPEDFIRKPHSECPKCGADRFGLLMVHGDRYWKRCASCLHSQSYPLPAIRKKVIYLDQMALSNMMFALNPDTRQFREGRVDPFWRNLFERLDALAKLQVIVCPGTEVHEHESRVHEHYKSLKRLAKQLSHNIHFRSTRTIERFQLHVHARSWIAGRAAEVPLLNREEVLEGDFDAWTDTLIITVSSQVTLEMIDVLRAERESVQEEFRPIFARWQGLTSFSFDAQFKKEVAAAGESAWRTYAEWVQRFAQVQMGLRMPSVDDIMFPSNVVLVHQLHEDFMRTGLDNDQAWQRVREYLSSPTLELVPSIRISCMLWAAIARKAASGMKKLPTRGVFNDVHVIAAVMPYSDALFVDNEMRAYLGEEPLATRLNYGARVFSAQNRDEFLSYLDDLAKGVPAEQIHQVKEVYGESWVKPFTAMFEKPQ